MEIIKIQTPRFRENSIFNPQNQPSCPDSRGGSHGQMIKRSLNSFFINDLSPCLLPIEGLAIHINCPNFLDNLDRASDFFAMHITRLHHVAVIGSDYQRSKHFYTEVLGFSVLAETFRAERHSYKLDLALPGGGQIELFSFPNPPARPSRPEACGLRHLALEVADLDAAVEFIQRQGVAVEAIRLDELTGKRYTFFADPDGLPIEFYEC